MKHRLNALSVFHLCLSVAFVSLTIASLPLRFILLCTIEWVSPTCDTCGAVNIELINTGSELMLGFVLNTHQQWICRQLSDHGYTVNRQLAVADSGPEIRDAVKEAMPRADVIITTGGLGPTSDDLTRNMIADLLGRKLIEDAAVLAHIEQFFSTRKRRMPSSTGVQALVPEGATVLHNPHGTAPGLLLEITPRQSGRPEPSILIMLPGPPRELQPMFRDSVLPILLQRYPRTDAYICRTFRTTGLGESFVEEKIASPLDHLVRNGLELGYCARLGEVDVRIVARGLAAEAMAREAESIIRREISRYIFGSNEELLEEVVVRLLTERHETLAVAESCTGGRISDRITDVPGASAILHSALTTYSNQAKQIFLGVREETLKAHGAVSKPTAQEMAEGIRARTGATYGISVTGIAGPSGGTAEKPVGTVYIGLSGPQGTLVLHNTNRYDRENFKQVTSQQALDLLRRKILDS